MLDFQILASMYAKRYAPTEWKQQLFQVDHRNLGPWLDQVRQAPDDPAYFDVLVRYVASLNDTHASYRMPSAFFASLGFHIDAYFTPDGKWVALIDSITRGQLPVARYPFQTGDELVAVDDVPVEEWVKRMTPYVNSGNDRSRLRIALSYIPSRSQSVLPLLHTLGDSAKVKVRRQSGAVEDYEIPWVKSGVPVTRLVGAPWVIPTATRTPAFTPSLEDPLLPLRNLSRDFDEDPKDVLNYGSRNPIWPQPEGFTQRRGRAGADFTYSGTFTHQDKRIGILRLPSFAPASNNAALAEIDAELEFFATETDGLLVDVTRNTGGDPCLAESILARFMNQPWQAVGRLFRPVLPDVLSIESQLALFRQAGRAEEVQLLEARLNDFRQAYESNSLTPPLSPCALNLSRAPGRAPYAKPVILLTDEFSTSAGDYFSVIFQENQRGPIYGKRTNGAGGSVLTFPIGFFSETGTGRVTVSMHYRPNPVQVDGYPATHFTENVGVRPNIDADLMSLENYRSGGRIWLTGAADALTRLINGQ